MPPDAPERASLEALRQLSEGLLRSAVRTGVRGNLLELHHPGAPLFDPLLLHSATHGFGVSISLRQDDGGGSGCGPAHGSGHGWGHDSEQRVRCRSAQLPFQEGVFNMVVLHHVIGDGDEPELAEAVRVLARNGVLLLLGLNRMGWRYRAQEGSPRLPGLAPLKVKLRLDAIDMVMQGFAGAGLAGRQRPAFLNDGLLGLATPFADLVLLQAHRRGSPGVTPLRFRKPRSAVVQSAPIRG